MMRSIALFLSIVSAPAAQLTWDELRHPDVVGYLLHYGPDPASPSQHVSVGNVTTATIDGLPIGSTIYFRCTAHDEFFAESGPSNQVSFVVPIPPTPDPTPEPTESPDGTKDTTITDALGNIWTLGVGGQILQNGVRIGNRRGQIYKYLSGIVYALGINGNWYEWSGSHWIRLGKTEPQNE
jgi:hypothetical protein